MKTLPALLCAFLLTAAPSFATNLYFATLSAVLYAPTGSGVVKPSVITGAALVKLVAANNSLLPSQVALVVNGDTANIEIIRKDTGAPLVTITTFGSATGTATNTAATVSYFSQAVSFSLPTGNFSGFVFARVTLNSGKVTAASYSFSGGTGNQVLKGTLVTSPRHLSF